MFRIVNPEHLYLYLLVPVFLLLFLLMRKWKREAMGKLGDTAVVARLMENVSSSKPFLKFTLMMLAYCCMVFALARPQLGSRLEEVKREGVDVMIALDVSNSMNATDIRPNRLERSKQAIYRMIDQLQGDRIGLIVFAGQAYVQLPITTDYGAAKLFLSTVQTNMVPTQGTAIGAAIEKAVEAFGDSTKHNSAVVVITDGENHEDDAVEAAKSAAAEGIVIHTIGMGSPDGAPIPLSGGNASTGFLQDKSGSTVITRLNDTMLQEIADAGKGKFVRATNSDDGIGAILEEVKSMEKKEFASKLFTDYEDQYQYFAGLALLFLLLDFMISERRSELLARLDLFGERGKRDNRGITNQQPLT
jgi:Ca-activated chloride channel family protein